ncbi:MAG: recombinase family protein [Actinobacteria bacterium]|nr:recombinase family protein [Actinomycetota bacterium]
MSTRCAIYLRQSLDATGDGLAIQRQREDCLTIAKARGWDVVGEYVDNSISASDARKKRPEYDRLVADFDAGMYDALVCWDLDRLTRQVRQLEDWIDRAEGRGLRLVTANGEADLTTDAGRLFARIKAAVARSEMERKSARQKRAARQRAERGLPPKGPRATGYATDGSVVPHEAAVVRRIFSSFVAGDSIHGIVRALIAEGVPTRRGGVWDTSSIHDILRNPRYAGIVTYLGERLDVDAKWTPLIDESTFAKTQEILNDPRRVTNRVGTHRRHLGAGLYRCGECGERVRTHSGGRYRCADAHVNRSGGQVDAFVLTVVTERLAQPDVRDLLVDTEADEALVEEARALRARLSQINSEYDDGVIDGPRWRTATEKVKASLATVERRMVNSTNAASGVLTAPDPVQAFTDASLDQQRAVIDTLMTVTLHRGVRGRKAFDPDSVVIEWQR